MSNLLEERVSNLEEKLGKSNLFGSNSNTLGSSSADLVLKTSGKIKIQWGNKFIDLIKDGKINADSKFIYTVASKDKIKSKNGIYIIDDGSVYLKSGDSIINLTGEVGTTYVSFMEELETTPDQKYLALKNLGLIYDNISSIDESALTNGIVYIESENKLYIISNGNLSEYSVNIPNPITELFVIEKSDLNQGALVIRGTGIENSIAFDSLYIYVDGASYFSSNLAINFLIADKSILTLDSSQSTFYNTTLCDTFQSRNATSEYGFRLYMNTGESYLEIDNLNVRNSSDTNNKSISPEYYSGKNNLITSSEFEIDDDETLVDATISLVLKYLNQYKVGDYLFVYAELPILIEDDDDDAEEDITVTTLKKIAFIVTEISDTSINVLIVSGFDSDIDSLTELPSLSGMITFLVSTDEEFKLIKYSENNIDLIKCSAFEDELSTSSIETRIGDLTELGYNSGVFSKQGVFKSISYTSDYSIDSDDKSTNLASTEWVQNLISGLTELIQDLVSSLTVPTGSIIMFNNLSYEIPEGWQICDGTNGTPDLSSLFLEDGENYSVVYIIKTI